MSPTSRCRRAGKVAGLRHRAALRSAAGDLHELGYNEVFIDPVTGEKVGKREWGAPWPISRENFVSFLYVLHYTLYIPEMWGIDHWGLWLMGGIALIWTVDCFVGFYLTLPVRNRAAKDRPAPSSAFCRAAGWTAGSPPGRSSAAARLPHQLRSASRLQPVALGISLHPRLQRARSTSMRRLRSPWCRCFPSFTPTPYDTRTERPDTADRAEGGLRRVLERHAEAAAAGFEPPAGDVFYARSYGVLRCPFFIRATTMASPAAARRRSISTPSTADTSATGCHGRGPRPTSSCSPVPAPLGPHPGLARPILVSAMGLVVAMPSR